MWNKTVPLVLALLLVLPIKGQELVNLNIVQDYWLTGFLANAGGNGVDAAGEISGTIGAMFNKSGGTHTCSSAGCAVYVDIQTATAWANVGTSVRIGLQDVGADGFGDGTFDVFADLVPGTETLTAATNRYAMESGSKSVANNQLVSLQLTMTARAGADAITPDGQQFVPSTYTNTGFPYGFRNAGANAKNLIMTKMMIEYDDGTYGWINGNYVLSYNQGANTGVTFGSGSTPDEYAVAGSFKKDCALSSITWAVDDQVSGDDYELLLYDSPLGTPAVHTGGTITANPVLTNLASGFNAQTYNFATPIIVSAGVQYGFAIRPTTVNTITIAYENITNSASIIAAYKAAQFLDGMGLYSRTNQTGAFGTIIGTAVPLFGLQCTQLVQ